jgi:hypothetical protein
MRALIISADRFEGSELAEPLRQMRVIFKVIGLA